MSIMVSVAYQSGKPHLTSATLGAGSMLSVFSKLGSEWVASRTGASNFGSMASSLASQIVSWLKLGQGIPKVRAQEPDRATAFDLCRGRWPVHYRIIPKFCAHSKSY